MNLADKLRERKVLQWAAGYFAVAWGLLEVLGFLANQFSWPAPIVRGATILLGSGILIVVILAWHHGSQGRQRVSTRELIMIAAVTAASGLLVFNIATPDADTAAEGPSGPVTRLTVSLDREQRLAIRGGLSYPLAISPDGKRIAYVSVIAGREQLALRALDSFEAVILEGTEDAMHPFFSPDGRWIGFFANRKLLKVAASGGAPIIIADTPAPSLGASWGPDNRILYSLIGKGLWLVGANGGAVSSVNVQIEQPGADSLSNVTSLVTNQSIAWPSILPGGTHAIATDRVGTIVFTLDSGKGRRLLPSNEQSRYVRSGHLLFTEAGEKLMAVSFDLDSLRVTGSPFSVLEDVFRAPGSGAMLFDVSSSGTLAYVTGGFQRSLHLTDRFGRGEPLTDDKRGFRFPRFSPDGRQVVVTIDPRPSGLWVYEVDRGTGEPLTTDGHNLLPIWPEGSDRIFFHRNSRIYSVDPLMPGSLIQLSPKEDQRNLYPHTISRDLQVIYGHMRTNENLSDIYALHLGDPPTLTARVSTAGNDNIAKVSPNDRWLAFASDVSGRIEVYVEPRMGDGPRVRVSVDGGTDPTWATDGRELYFRHGNRIMMTAVDEDETLSFSTPELLFVSPDLDVTQERNWDAGPGGRFVLVQSDPSTTSEFQVVLNWFGVLADQPSP